MIVVCSAVQYVCLVLFEAFRWVVVLLLLLLSRAMIRMFIREQIDVEYELRI